MVRWQQAHALAVVVFLFTFAGCVDDPDGGSNPSSDPGTSTAPDAASCPDPPRADAVVPGCPLAARTLPGGTRLTYTASGVWDLAPTLEVIVIRNDDGYLFAGGSKAQIYDAAMWWRHQYGPHDLDLNLLGTDGTPRPLFDWPLHDNKTWKYHESDVVAHEADVPIPGGTERGFHMTRTDGETTYTWTYAPSVGYLTTYTYGDSNWTYESIRLDKVDTATEWTWFERGPYFSAGIHQGTAPYTHAATWDVPAGHDDLVFIGLGAQGTRAAITSPTPGLTPWSFEGGPDWTWSITTSPATAGPWTLGFTRTDETAYIGVEAVAVTWLDP